jgi:hypothetical protein
MVKKVPMKIPLLCPGISVFETFPGMPPNGTMNGPFPNSYARLLNRRKTTIVLGLIAVLIQLGSIGFISFMVSTGRWADVQYPTISSFPVYHDRTDLNKTLRETPDSPTAQFSGNDIQLDYNETPYKISVSWAIVLFFGLSAAFEGVGTMLVAFSSPASWIYRLRFIEYSLSASVMLVVIAVQVGIWDWRTLFCISFLSSVCMLCGIISESEIQWQNRNSLTVFAIGSLALVAAWTPIITTYYDAMSNASKFGREVPVWITAILAVEFFLFSSFGILQFLQILFLMRSDKVLIPYTFLSILSKSVLGWVVVSQVLANKN